MTHTFPRHTKVHYPIATTGKGVYLYDSEGKQYFDGSGGAAVSCLGHNDASVINAIKDQLDTLAFAHTRYFTSRPAETLAETLISYAPKNISRVYFVSGGSEAIETALKLARQYFIESGQPKRHKIIGREQSYHGNTLGALAVGGNIWRRKPYEPLLIDAYHIPPCFAYRDKKDDESEYDYGQRVANALEKEILRLGADQVMAFIAEPVVGTTLGAAPPVEGYFKRIREICDQYGILLILDEVMCGTGRTGSLFACEQDGISPDILTMAKGLGAGYQPIGATLCTEKIYQAFEQGSGFFQHGHSYLAHPTATAASLAVIKRLMGDSVLKRVHPMGEKLRDALEARFGNHPYVGDIRGRGLFIGMEFVEDKLSKTPFAPERNINGAIKSTTFSNGLVCYPNGGTIDGRLGDHLLLAPPFILEDHHIEEIVDKLDKSFQSIFS